MIELTIGKVYESLYESEFLYVIDDRGIEGYVDKNDFVSLEEFREEKLNSLHLWI
jgi:hypothetical protein